MHDENIAELAKLAKTHKQARYAKRYAPLKTIIENAEAGCTVKIVTLAVGVAAWIPEFTRKNIKLIANGRDVKDLRKRLGDTARIWAIAAYRAWQDEDRGETDP